MELGERGEARLDDAVRPLVDLVVHVAVAADRALYRLLYDVGDLVDHELGLQEKRKQFISLSSLTVTVSCQFCSVNSLSHLLCRFICHFRGVRLRGSEPFLTIEDLQQKLITQSRPIKRPRFLLSFETWNVFLQLDTLTLLSNRERYITQWNI